jgi:hypothetical protein
MNILNKQLQTTNWVALLHGVGCGPTLLCKIISVTKYYTRLLHGVGLCFFFTLV